MTGPSTTADQHLALTSVVASGLPASLGTDAAERFYDVPPSSTDDPILKRSQRWKAPEVTICYSGPATRM